MVAVGSVVVAGRGFVGASWDSVFEGSGIRFVVVGVGCSTTLVAGGIVGFVAQHSIGILVVCTEAGKAAHMVCRHYRRVFQPEFANGIADSQVGFSRYTQKLQQPGEAGLLG